MVNNFPKIRSFLNWDNDDIFYFCQVIKRKKENPELGSNSQVISTYYIKSLDHLDKYTAEMMLLAELHNARACINLNKRSFRKTAFRTLKKITDQILNNDFPNVRRAYASVCGDLSEGDKIWIVDIDEEKIPNGMIELINDLEPIGDKILMKLPTKNGIHLITKPFRLDHFHNVFPKVDVHKNNPTILYIP